MAKALEKGGARKVYILGRRKDKLESVAKEAVCCRNSIPFTVLFSIALSRSTH